MNEHVRGCTMAILSSATPHKHLSGGANEAYTREMWQQHTSLFLLLSLILEEVILWITWIAICVRFHSCYCWIYMQWAVMIRSPLSCKCIHVSPLCLCQSSLNKNYPLLADPTSHPQWQWVTVLNLAPDWKKASSEQWSNRQPPLSLANSVASGVTVKNKSSAEMHQQPTQNRVSYRDTEGSLHGLCFGVTGAFNC